MNDFMDKAKNFADQHDDKVDEGIEKAGEQVDQRTGGKYDEKIDKGVDMAQQHTGDGDQDR
jgi:hypothetical protein